MVADVLTKLTKKLKSFAQNIFGTKKCTVFLFTLNKGNHLIGLVVVFCS